jgi:hypothetical protein
MELEEAIVARLKGGPRHLRRFLDLGDRAEVEAALVSLVEKRTIKVSSDGLYRIDPPFKLYD